MFKFVDVKVDMVVKFRSCKLEMVYLSRKYPPIGGIDTKKYLFFPEFGIEPEGIPYIWKKEKYRDLSLTIKEPNFYA